MAVFTTNNIFPGIIDTAMPGFDINDGQVKVYVELSKYNKFTDIKANCVQVTLKHQNNNLNALADSSEITMTTLVQENDKYYFILSADALADGEFVPYHYYKLQFRFTDKAASNYTAGSSIDAWLNSNSTVSGKTNLDQSSEWSSICLIRGITTFNLDVIGLDEDLTESNPQNITDGLSYIIGKVDFTADDGGNICDEVLKSYQIKLYKSSNLILDSGVQYIDNYATLNQFKYDLKQAFAYNEVYHMQIISTTNSLYVHTDDYYFKIIDGSTELTFSPTIEVTPQEEDGVIKIEVTSATFPSGATHIAVYRSDAETGFTYLEKIRQDTHSGTGRMTYIIYDRTIESGMLYKYSVRALNPAANKQSAKVTSEAVGLILDYCYLTSANKQLKIKFNPKVSSMKTILAENKTDTLGSQFPFIRRNGAVKYKTFPISGLISHFIDENEYFTSKEELYGEDNLELYSEFNSRYNINRFRDFQYERLFKEKVAEFLEDGELKLFRSPTEGNILIRLMDVNYSPNDTLGRMLWTFSGTAYEMDNCSIDNFDKFGIQYIEKEQSQIDSYGNPTYGSVMTHTNNEVIEMED